MAASPLASTVASVWPCKVGCFALEKNVTLVTFTMTLGSLALQGSSSSSQQQSANEHTTFPCMPMYILCNAFSTDKLPIHKPQE